MNLTKMILIGLAALVLTAETKASDVTITNTIVQPATMSVCPGSTVEAIVIKVTNNDITPLAINSWGFLFSGSGSVGDFTSDFYEDSNKNGIVDGGDFNFGGVTGWSNFTGPWSCYWENGMYDTPIPVGQSVDFILAVTFNSTAPIGKTYQLKMDPSQLFGLTSTYTVTDNSTSTTFTIANCSGANTSTSTCTNTQTPTHTATSTCTQSATSTSTQTNTPLVSTSTYTNTLTSTSTSTQTNTSTPLASTATSTNTQTATSTSSQTNTSTPLGSTATMTSTSTDTQTDTTTSTQTQTSTSTPLASTATSTNTNTASSTSTQTSTNTPKGPTSTTTSTNTVTETPTQTLSPTFTFTASPTAVDHVVYSPPFPNPSAGGPIQFNITTPGAATIEMEVYTTAFRKISEHSFTVAGGNGPQGTMTSLTWDLHDRMNLLVSNGLYYVRIKVNGGNESDKIFKVLVLR